MIWSSLGSGSHSGAACDSYVVGIGDPKLPSSKMTTESKIVSVPSPMANLMWYVSPQMTGYTAVNTVVYPFMQTSSGASFKM